MVRWQSGRKSDGWFAKTFGGPRSNESTWRKYRTGQRRVSAAIVSKVDKYFYGASDIYHSAIWDFLIPERAKLRRFSLTGSERDDAIGEIQKLGPPMSTIILNQGLFESDSGQRTFTDVFNEMREFPDFDNLEAIVFILAWADADGNVMLWNEACDFYRSMIPYYLLHSTLRYCWLIFDVVDRYAQYRTFPKANVREDILVPWTTQLPTYKKLWRENRRLKAEATEIAMRRLIKQQKRFARKRPSRQANQVLSTKSRSGL